MNRLNTEIFVLGHLQTKSLVSITTYADMKCMYVSVCGKY